MFVLSIDIGIKHLAHCLFHIENEIKIIEWDVINLTVERVCTTCGKKATKTNQVNDYCNKHSKLLTTSDIKYKKSSEYELSELGLTMKHKYNDIFNPYKIDTVLIENQIGPLANRMKTLQGMIIQYWLMKDKPPTIQCISSSNKLKLFVKGKTNYKERKKLSIHYTKLNMQEEWSDHFESHKKKDDLADTYLQGLWYLNNKCGILKIKCS